MSKEGAHVAWIAAMGTEDATAHMQGCHLELETEAKSQIHFCSSLPVQHY